MSRTPWALCLGGVLLIIAGCTQGEGSVAAGSAAAVPEAPPTLGAQSAGDLVHAAVGLYTIAIDPQTLSASVQPSAVRAGSQSELYSLSIEEFMTPNTFVVNGVSLGNETLNLTYTVTHPIPPPFDLEGAASASNRADLCATGRVVFLLDDPDAEVYFEGDGDVRANTRLVVNAEGYVQPGALLNLPGMQANTFPYKPIVDELVDGTGNRLGVSNGGDVTGNFGADGWGIPEFTAGPTGFGLWAQGQSARSTVQFDRSAIEGGSTLVLRTAILVKYEDPRGGETIAEKRANRLPGNGRNFAYRMPHGALDVESINIEAVEGFFSETVEQSVELRAHVVDWDATAPQAFWTNLEGLELNVVSRGEAGVPTVEVDIPALTSLAGATLTLADDDTEDGGDPENDSGQPGDALYFTSVMTSSAPAGTEGEARGLVRATDITDLVPPIEWELLRFNLAPDLSVLPTHLEGATYQAFPVTITTAELTAPQGEWSIVSNPIFDGGTARVILNFATDVDGSRFDIEVDWGDGAGWVLADENLGPGFGPYGPYSSPDPYVLADPGVAETRTLAMRLIDGQTGVPNPATNVGGDVLDIIPLPPPGECTVPAPPKTAANITAFFTGVTGYDWATIGGAPAKNFNDIAAFSDPAFAGWAVQMSTLGNTGPFWRLTDAEPPVAIQMTTFNAENKVNQIEIDSANRVIYSEWIPILGDDFGNDGDPDEIYDIAFGAEPDFFWFDYAGSLVASLGGTISTDGQPVIALALDANDNVYVITQSHVVRKFVKSAGYTEDTSAPWPWNLTEHIGSYTDTNDMNDRKVVDFVFNFHNGAFYVLVTQETDWTTDNGRIYRFECDGTKLESVNGHGNPWVGKFSWGGSMVGADIVIDQWDSAGNLLTDQADVQLVTSSMSNLSSVFDGVPDLRIFTSELEATAGLDIEDWFFESLGDVAISLGDRLIGKQGSFLNDGVYIYPTPPAGWE